jgi:hypothetical protein
MRAVTIAAAVMAILFSALTTLPEIDHQILSSRPVVASVADSGAFDDGSVQPEPDAKCHVGHSCLLVIIPGNEIAIAHFDGVPEFPRVTGYAPSGAGELPFHPPRLLSQV